MDKTGWPAPALMQDDHRALFRWFASRLGSRRLVREACAKIKGDQAAIRRAVARIDNSHRPVPLVSVDQCCETVCHGRDQQEPERPAHRV